MDQTSSAEDAGADGIELNFGCPHPAMMPGVHGGSMIGQEPEVAREVTARVCEAVKDYEKAGILYRRALFLAPDMMGQMLPPLIENLEKQAVAVNQPKPAPSAPPPPAPSEKQQ